jgi:hypothetical protein
MELSNDTQKILSAIDKLSKDKLNYREDLGRLIELSIQNNKMKVLEELSFQARYSQGLLKIVQNRDNKIEEEYFSKVQKEFAQSVEKIKSSIEEILSNSSPFIKQIFSDKYLQITHASLSNLNKFCPDLGFVKFYFNDLKREY